MKKQITYTEHNGLYYPDLALPEQSNYPLGKYMWSCKADPTHI